MENPLGEIRKQPSLPLHERVYRGVRRAIVAGFYQPGTHLTEEELSAEAGVSRTPVREALRRLASEGFVEYSPNKGVLVVSLGEKEIRDVWRLRAALSGLAAELAAERITVPALMEMDKLYESMIAACHAGDFEYVAALLMEFDGAISEAAGNRQLSLMLDAIEPITWDLRYLVNTSPIREARPYEDHARILLAIRTGDGAMARRLTEEHVLQWGEVFAREFGNR